MNVSTIFYMYTINAPKETKCTSWDLEVFSSFLISEEQLWKEDFFPQQWQKHLEKFQGFCIYLEEANYKLICWVEPNILDWKFITS